MQDDDDEKLRAPLMAVLIEVDLSMVNRQKVEETWTKGVNTINGP